MHLLTASEACLRNSQRRPLPGRPSPSPVATHRHHRRRHQGVGLRRPRSRARGGRHHGRGGEIPEAARPAPCGAGRTEGCLPRRRHAHHRQLEDHGRHALRTGLWRREESSAMLAPSSSARFRRWSSRAWATHPQPAIPGTLSTPGGSSSGSGAAVGARTIPVAIGTQTGGSNLRPAAFCGVVGFKGTWGRISRSGIYTVSWGLDHPGVIARSVQDLALVFSCISGPEAGDPHPSPGRASTRRPCPCRDESPPHRRRPRLLLRQVRPCDVRSHRSARCRSTLPPAPKSLKCVCRRSSTLTPPPTGSS